MSMSYQYVGQNYHYHCYKTFFTLFLCPTNWKHYVHIYWNIDIANVCTSPSKREVRTCSWSSGDIYIYHEYICNIDIHHPLKTRKCCQTHINRYQNILQKLYSFSTILLYLIKSHPIPLKSDAPEKSDSWGRQLRSPKCTQLALNPNAFTESPIAFSAIK